MNLKYYLDKGYLVLRGAIPNLKPDYNFHIPLRDPNTLQTFLYPTNSEEEASVANSEWKSNKESPVMFQPAVVIAIRGFHSFENELFDLGTLSKIFNGYGYQVEINDGVNIEVKLGEFVNSASVDKEIEKLNAELFRLSIAYKISFDIVATGKGESYNFQPFNFGPVQKVRTRLEKTEVKEIALEVLTEEQLDFLEKLKSFYGQTSIRSKIIVGWALLEDYFVKGKTQIENSVWKTMRFHAQQVGIINNDFEKLYGFRCAKAHEFKDGPDAYVAIMEIDDILDKMKTNMFTL